jgi:hypothetical protein
VAALAAAHGGVAFVRSAPGQGAVFTVELPVTDAEKDTVAPSAPSPPFEDPSAAPADAQSREVVDHGTRPGRR